MSNIQTAIIFASSPDAQNNIPLSLLSVGGRSLLARNIIQLSRQGINRFLIVADDEHIDAIKEDTANLEQDIIVSSSLQVEGAFAETELALFLRGEALIDDRIMADMLSRKDKHLYAYGIDAETDDETVYVIKAPVAAHRDARSFGELTDKIREDDVSGFDISSLPLYIANRRREVAILADHATDPSQLATMTDRVLGMAQKGTLDWPARWIHPFFENNMVKLLLPTKVTPNMITVITGIIGFWITYLFATGSMIAATIGAMVIGVLDGVDGKLARTKMLESNVGELEHLVDKVVEYSWYFAMAYYFSETHGNAVWGLAVIAVCFAWAETVQGEFYRRLTGVQLDDAGTFEKYWRLIGGRRNTFIWCFLPFALLGAAYEGLWMIALYSLITFFVAQIRFIVRFRNYAYKNGSKIAKNWTETAYF